MKEKTTVPEYKYPIWGAILGDIAGSVFEGAKISGNTLEEAAVDSYCNYFKNLHKNLHIGTKINDFPLLEMEDQRFTDDTVLTTAVAYANKEEIPISISLKLFANTYPEAGYGSFFKEWSKNLNTTINNKSFGNGAAMRISPIVCSYYNPNLHKVYLNKLKDSPYSSFLTNDVIKVSEITHDSKDGIDGADAIAHAILLSLFKIKKEKIKDYIQNNYNYDLSKPIDELRNINNKFTSDAIKTVPIAISSFLESNSLENAIRLAISYGGDTDTIASMTGAISAAYYGISTYLLDRIQDFLDDNIIYAISES